MSPSSAPADDPASYFEPRGALAAAHPAYEHRPGQERMATAVADALDEGGVLFVEAGTGTGKTLAYLIPAILSGRRVVISTGTRNLQDQIFNLDVPFLRDELGLDVPVTMMKGRGNYLCRYRLSRFEEEPMFEDLAERSWLPRIADWSATTETGDRAEIADLPESLRLWNDVNARADTCTGRRCPEFEACWLTRLKREAEQSRLLVVNHHLFFADLAVRTSFGSVLPEYDAVIFDEAHLIEEVATLYFGLQASSRQLEDLARDAEKAAAAGGVPGDGGAGELREATRDFLIPLLHTVGARQGRQRLEPASSGGPDLEAEWAVLSEALDELIRRAALIEGEEPGSDSVPRRAEELHETLARILGRDDPGFVYGVERRGRRGAMVSASPIDVSEVLRSNVFTRLHGCVLTSATLAVRGGFEFLSNRLGADEPRSLVVESPFDYPRQAALLLPRGIPEPQTPNFVERAVDTIERLLRITDGRAFLLFTSYANLGRVQEALAATDEWPLFVQGDGTKAAMVESFKRTPRAVLLGTSSFWHGVDVPGEALSLVVVDKLPFGVPSDPLVSARIERLRREGGNPFYDYQVPMAVLELKQGLGRLIRNRRDRGLLAVLDPRLRTRGYGKVFLDSLPPYRRVDDIDAATRFYAEGGRDSDA